MTDERMGAGLLPAIRRLPPGSGIVFRHYTLSAAARRRLFRTIRRIARARGLTLLRAGDQPMPGEDGVHNDGHPHVPMRSMAVHDLDDVHRARRSGAAIAFVSPVYPTRSHPRATGLGIRRASRLARATGMKAIALGGMDGRRWRTLRGRPGWHGWAAIDALRGNQKRKDVPT